MKCDSKGIPVWKKSFDICIPMDMVLKVDGGFLLIGNNNQLQNNDLVSPTRIILLKLNADLTVQWTKELRTGNPAKAYDAVFLNDGTIGLIALLKENLSENKLMYMRLDASGSLIIN